MSATTRANATRNKPLAASGRNTKSITTLWDAANAKLDPKTRRSLANVNIGNGRVVDAVLKEAVTQQKALAAKRWKMTIGGKEVILRDVLAKIVRWIDHFKAAGDVAVQFNSGAASLPWAAVRFLLQVAINDKQYLEATIEGIEVVTQIIARYAAVENLYMDSDFQLHTQIRNKVLGLYVHILSFLGESIQYFQHTMARRTAKGAFQTSQSERLQKIAKDDTEIRQLTKMCDSHVQRLIQTDVMRINQNIVTSLKAQSLSDFIAWLSSTPYKEHHTRHSKNRLCGTTQWLISDPRYVEWKNSTSSSLMWLRGILGSGKTNLVSAVIDESLEDAKTQPSPVLYYYCGDNKGQGGKCDAKDVMRSLLRQLTVKNEDTFEIVEQVHLEFKRREARGKIGMGKVDALEPYECTHWIADLLQTDTATIIIDAIDEIDIADRHLLLKELIELRDDSARVLKIMLSSRDDTNLAQWLRGSTEICLQASLTQTDMRHFIGHCVSSAIDNKHLLDGLVDSTLRSQLESYFLGRANGMFRWVELQLRHFCDLKSKHSIELAMLDPAGASIRTLNHLYATIFDKIVETDPLAYKIAAQTFRLMMCLHESMSPAALLFAASITRENARYTLELSDLLRTCSHLVVLDDELNTLRFAHASVQEYLSRLPEFSAATSNSTAAWSCLMRCIDNPMPDLTLGIQPARDFDVYAAMYWPLHYKSASEHDRGNYLEQILKDFMFSEEEFMSPFPSWIETVEKISGTLSGPHARLSDLTAIGSESATPLFTACIYGFESAITILSGKGTFDVNEKNRRGHTGIYLASATGQTRVVDTLLSLGADISIGSGRHTTALQAACANGHEETAQLILSFLSLDLTTETITSAVQVALRSGHENIAVILLKQNASPMSQDSLHEVFEAAAGMGFIELMDYIHLTSKPLTENKKLATRGAEKTFHDSKILRFRNYFQNKALPKDAVATAAFYGQNEIIKFCIDKGLDIEHEGPFGTPLRAASLMGHGKTVRFLLDKNAEVNANGSFGDALQAAAMRGHLSIATTLIQSGVAVDNSGGYYGNALQAATNRGHIEIVKALLTAGASIGQRGLFLDAVSAAVSAGNQYIADLLVRSDYTSPYFRNQDEVMRASMMAKRGLPPSHVDLLSALDLTYKYKPTRPAARANVSRGQDLSFEEAYKSVHAGVEFNSGKELPKFQHHEGADSHPLLLATVTGQESVVRSMLDSRSAVGLSLLDIGALLHAACTAGHLGIVDYILLLPEPPKKDIPRALERAAWYGHVVIVKRLLERVESHGPPPETHYDPFTPLGKEKNWTGLIGDNRWSEHFFPAARSRAADTNETAEDGHIVRILLQGCRADAAATVEFALELATGSELQNLFTLALPLVVRSDSVRVIEVLFRHYPAALDAVTYKKVCAQAEEDGAVSVLYFLLQHNSDHGYELQDYWNLFDGAASAAHSELISYLVTQTLHCLEDSVFVRSFIEAAQGGYVSAMKAWEGRLFDFAHYRLALSQALDQACANGHVEVVSYLIEYGVDVNATVEEPVEPSSIGKFQDPSRKPRFIFVHRKGRKLRYDQKTEYQERWGVKPLKCLDGFSKSQAWPRTALQACLQATPQSDRISGIDIEKVDEFRDKKREFLSNQEAIVTLLLREGADVNAVDSHGRSSLHYAALCSPLATIRAILVNGAAIDALDSDNKTPLIHAVWREIDSYLVFEALAEAATHSNSLASDQASSSLLLDTALSVFRDGFIESESVHQVISTGAGAIIRYLLRSQPDLQAIADECTLLLQMASADGDIDFVQLLIERKVEFKAVAHYYGTALHAAAQFGHIDCVKLLVEAGAEIALTAGRFGWTPLRAAVQGQHLAVVQFLLDVGVMQLLDYSADELTAGMNDKCSTLTLACRSGNIELVQLLLSYSEQNSPLLLERSGKRTTNFADLSSALHGACTCGHTQIVVLLIAYGADVEQGSGQFQSPLVTAASAGKLETMKVLLAAGGVLYDGKRNINILRTLVIEQKRKEIVDHVLDQLLGTEHFVDACKEVPAYIRAWKEDAEFVLNIDTMPSSERLLTYLAALGARRSIELKLETSDNAAIVSPPVIEAAAYFQSHELLFMLLPIAVLPQPLEIGHQSPVYALMNGLMPIRLRVEKEYKSLCCETCAIDTFWYRYYNPDGPQKKCGCEGARATTTEAIMKLAQMNESYIRASDGILHLASYLGMLQVVHACIDSGVDINQHHDPFGSALVAAIEGGSSEVTVFLLQHPIDVNTMSHEHGTPLYLACKTRNTELLRAILQRGALIDQAVPGTGTALHMACQNGDREIAEVLLQHGAKVDVLVPGKGTPMHVACERRNEEMLKLLLAHGADVDIISPDLGAALHVSGKSNASALMEILLKHGANVNIFSPNHGTPIHTAYKGYGNVGTLKLLVKYGADVNSKGCKGETVLTSTLSRDSKLTAEHSIEALLDTEQQLDVTEEDLALLVTKIQSSKVCKRVLENNEHVQPSIETIRQALASVGQFNSDIIRLLLERASYLEMTPEVLKSAKIVGNLELLLQHGSGTKITGDVMEAFTNPLQLDLLRYCVESAPDVRPPAAVIAAIRAVLDEEEPKVARPRRRRDPLEVPNLLSHFMRQGGERRKPKKALAKELMELILARYPDIAVLPTTAAPEDIETVIAE